MSSLLRLFPHSEERKLSKMIPKARRTPLKAQDDICIIHTSITAIAIADNGDHLSSARYVSAVSLLGPVQLCHVFLRRPNNYPLPNPQLRQ